MSDAHHYYRVPGKRMSAAALFYDDEGRILIVKPTYRPEWLLPGGSLEEGESPHAGCAREVAEELGLALPIGRLLCIEWQAARPPARPESVKLIFDGGRLDAATLANFRLQATELAGYELRPPAEAAELLAPRIRSRTAHALIALERGTTIYLEDGLPVGQ